MKYIEKLRLLVILGWRNIWRQKKRSYLVIASGVIGLMGVYLSVGLMNGLSAMWLDSAIDSGTGHVQIRPQGFAKTREGKSRFKNKERISAIISNVKDSIIQKTESQKIFYAPRFERIGFLRLGSATQGVNVLGVEPSLEKNISKFDDWLIEGEYLNAAARNDGQGENQNDERYGIIPAFLGKANAQKFEVEAGDTVILSISSDTGVTRSARIRIKGIFQAIAEPIEKSILLIPREKLSHLFNETKDEHSYYVFKTGNRKFAESLKKDIKKISSLGKTKAGQTKTDQAEADVLTYKELQPSINRLLELTDSVIFIFYLIMLSSFAFVLLNSILMSVFERTREIGILRAIGSSGGDVFGMILIESILLGIMGAFVGFIVSGSIVLIFSQTGLSLEAFAKGMETWGGAGTRIYPSLRLQDIYIGFSISLIISALASIYPALRAVKLQPIKAIYNR